MAVSLQAWLASLQALLPPGRALTRQPDSKLSALLEAIAAMFLAAQLRLEALQRESDPRRATTMLPDWEQLLGLPDECMLGLDLSLADRQRLAFARLTEKGGQSKAHFIALAEAYGEPGCTIDDGFRPFNCNDDCTDALHSDADRFVWRVNVPRPLEDFRAFNCNDDCNDALQEFTPSLIECPIRERKPAHTSVIFSYGA